MQTGVYLSTVLLIFTTLVSFYGVKLLMDVAKDLKFEGGKIEDLCTQACGTFTLIARPRHREADFDIVDRNADVGLHRLDCLHGGLLGSCGLQPWGGQSVRATEDVHAGVLHHIDTHRHDREPLMFFLRFSFRHNRDHDFRYASLLNQVFTISYYDIGFIFSGVLPEGGPIRLNEYSEVASFIGIGLFSMEVASHYSQGIGMVFPLRQEMNNPEKFSRLYPRVIFLVFMICFLFASISYIVSGLTDAQAIGNMVRDVIFYSFGPKFTFLFVLEILYSIVASF
jgi:hypothetical protein